MDHHLLVSELQALVVEAKRRHADVREAGEKALEVLKSGPTSQDTLVGNADIMLSPIALGCRTKTPKVIGIAITALQRVVALRGIPTSSLPSVLQTLNSVSNQGVDIQLKILQALLSILTYNSDAHGEIMGNALLLCFKLQDARVSVVSSTAAATLRQAVMLVFDRIPLNAPDAEAGSNNVTLSLPTEPPAEMSISPSCMDAYCVLSDLCLLTSRSGSGSGSGLLSWGGGEKEKPKLLVLSNLQRTFGLELIESILSGYEESVKKRPELVHLLSHSLNPLLLKLLAEKPTFPIALRVCRLIFLLIRSFAEQLPKEVEVYLSTLIRLGMGESEEDSSRKDSVQPWFRVLALEIIRGICGDARLLQNLFSQYDQQGEPRMFAKLVTSLSRLMSEKPNLLGISEQMHGLGVPTGEANGPQAGYLDIGFGMVATAANVGVSTVSSMMGSHGGGLGPQSSLKLKLIEQHDKAEAPLIPETYIYLLALQSLDAVASGIYASANRSETPAPLLVGMAESAWPALLAALSFILATNLSDTLFAEVLSTLQEFTFACNSLSLWMPRNAFLNTLGRYAVPPPVVSAMQTYLEGGSGRKESVISPEGLGITAALGVGGSNSAPSLSERNLACLKTTISTAKNLSADLDTAWHDVLEVLQNASFMLGAKRPSVTRRGTVASPRIGSTPLRTRDSVDEPRSEVFEGIDTEDISIAINVLFDSTTQMEDKSFTTFISALCQLSSEMIGVSAARSSAAEMEEPATPRLASFPMSPGPENRRRTSGITISSSTKSGEKSFSLGKLRIVGMLNLNRLVNSEVDVGWDIITRHLLSVARHSSAPSTVRVQASETLGELLLGSMRAAKSSNIQHMVFDVLGAQVAVEPVSNLISTDYDVRSAGYQTLNQVLESSGHSLEVGWGTIFAMLNDVCRVDTSNHSSSEPRHSHLSANRISAYNKGNANLVRIAFPSLNLICTDFLSALDHDAIRQCILCLGFFGRQKEDVNIALSAIGLMWNVSDAVQGDSKGIWLELLLQMLDLGRDERSEVQSTAMQTLFKCIELYGSGLSSPLWDEVWWKVIYPILESSSGNDSQVLALDSVGNIFNSFINQLADLSTFEKLYSSLLAQIEQAFGAAERQSSLAAIKALEKVLQALQPSQPPSPLDSKSRADREAAVAAIWSAFLRMSQIIESKEGFTQETLVALVRVADLLHSYVQPEEPRQKALSKTLRTIMIYSESPEYRPDVDVVSPLQKAVLELVLSSIRSAPSLALSNLAWFVSLAFNDTDSQSLFTSKKPTYIGLAKACMPKIPDLLRNSTGTIAEFGAETTLDILKAYEAPIKLRYSCPPSCRFNDDPPLWRTAMTSVNSVLEWVIDYPHSNQADRQSFWTEIIDLLEALLLADITPQTSDDETYVMSNLDRFKSAVLTRMVDADLPSSLIERYTDILRQASIIYRYDALVVGGTTCSVIPVPSEALAYWALDLLVHNVQYSVSTNNDATSNRAAGGLAEIAMSTLLQRFQDGLRRHVDDTKIRGRVPLPRVRQDETMYILRQLVTISLSDRVQEPDQSKIQTSSRSCLVRFYPLLLDISFLEHSLPSTWITPPEHELLFKDTHVTTTTAPTPTRIPTILYGADDYIEITARDLARRCLELIGREQDMGGYHKIR